MAASLDTDLPRLRPMPLSESEKRREECESAEVMEERSSEDALWPEPLFDWLRWRKLLLPMRRNSPSG